MWGKERSQRNLAKSHVQALPAARLVWERPALVRVRPNDAASTEGGNGNDGVAHYS
jgi:hypothetical protein